MWLNSDSESLAIDEGANTGGTMETWMIDTAKTVLATSTAVILSAVIHKIQGDIVNVGVPQQHRLGTQGIASPATSSWGNSGFSPDQLLSHYN